MSTREFVLIDDKREKEIEEKIQDINRTNDPPKSVFNREQSIFKQIPMMSGLKLKYPSVKDNITVPSINNFYKTQSRGPLLTPAPPYTNEMDRNKYKMVKKFVNKYNHIWILVTELDHPARKVFSQAYQFEKLDNVNHNLETLLTGDNIQEYKHFTKHGASIKMMTDYPTFKKFFKNAKQQKNYLIDQEKQAKILEVYVEKGQGGGVLTTKKVKVVDSLVDLIDEQAKLDIEKSRKDKPYYNFVHSNSTPELFARRSIMKDSLILKSQVELIQNNKIFVKMLHNFNKDEKERRDKQALNKHRGSEQALDQSFKKYKLWETRIADYETTIQQCLNKNFPLEQQEDRVKQNFYVEFISFYSMQSPIYGVVNNTIRFSTNNENVRPLSTFIRYLYDAIRYYFTTYYRQITFNKVYRGARISLAEQVSLVKGRHIRNLGFMSTSRSKHVAEKFLSMYKNPNETEQRQGVLMIINIPKISGQLDYLADQEGFYSIDRIPEVRNRIQIVQNQQEVLFNPLNIFEVENWDTQTKVLTLKYAPHLQIFQKKKKGQSLTELEKDFLSSITKLKETHFDKGQQLLDQGDPSAAVKFYEQSSQSGSNLTFAQKANYIKGLMEVGDIQKMEKIIEESIEAEVKVAKQIEDEVSTQASISSIEKIVDSVQCVSLLQHTGDLILADEKAEIIMEKSAKKSIEMPSQQTLLLQTQANIQLAKAKQKVGQTLDSIKYSIKSLKIIDRLAQINFCFRLYQLGQDIKKIDKKYVQFKKKENVNWDYILKEEHYLSCNLEEEKQKALQQINIIREGRDREGSSSKFKESKRAAAQKQAEELLENYFSQERFKRSQYQQFQLKFVHTYWEAQGSRVVNIKNELDQKQYVQLQQKLKNCLDILFCIKNDYKQLFFKEVQAYQVLYRNIYKTNISVKACLESYHKNLYYRFQNFIDHEEKNEGASVDTAQVYWKYAEILYEYGQIVERPLLNQNNDQEKRSMKTKAQSLAEQKIDKANQIISKLERKEIKISGNRKAYTFQKSQISRIRSYYLKSKVVEKQKIKKDSLKNSTASTASTRSSAIKITESAQSVEEKAENFTKLVQIIQERKQICENDPNINQAIYKIKNACEKIEVLNDSANIVIQNDTYTDRLRLCKAEFEDVMTTIQKQNERQLKQKNINMAQLYLLMGENQFRLGIISNAKKYLDLSNSCIKKALKFDDEKYKGTDLATWEKVFLQNSTYLGCLKLQARVVAFFGTEEDKKFFYQNLIKRKDIMFAELNDPINEAQINQSIGIVAINLVMFHDQLSYFTKAKNYYTQAIKIREKLFSPFNKFSARNYALMVKTISNKKIKDNHEKELSEFYKTAVKIYDRLDLSTQSTLILHRMQLRSTYLMFTYKNEEACNVILEDLQYFAGCQNKQMTLEAAEELFRCSKYLADHSKRSEDAIQWLEETNDFVQELQNLVSKMQNQGTQKERKHHLMKLRIEVLKKITDTYLKEQGKEGTNFKFYYQEYKKEKTQYEKLEEA